MSSHEIANRTALRNLIAGLTSWQEWTNLNEAGAAGRIGWPSQDMDALPCIVLVTLSGGRRNRSGSDFSANFRSHGGIGVMVFAEVSDNDDLNESDTDFGTKFFGLIDEIAEAAHGTAIMVEEISYEANPYVLGAINSATAEDANNDGEDDAAASEKKIWQGMFQISTGLG